MHPVRKTNFAKRLMILFAFIAVTAVITSLSVNYYIQSKGGLAAFASQSLSNNALGIQVDVSTANFKLNGNRSIDVTLGDIMVKKEDQQIVIPEALFQFSWRSLYSFSPEKIIIQSSDMVLFKDSAGIAVGGAPSWFTDQISDQISGQINEAMDASAPLSVFPFWLQGVREFTITGNQLSLYDRAVPDKPISQWADISLSIVPLFQNDSHQLNVRAIAVEKVDGRRSGQFNIEVVADLFSSLNAFNAKLQDISVRSIEPFLSLPNAVQDTAKTKISGNFAGSSDGFHLQNVNADIVLKDAAISHEAFGGDVKLQEFSADVKYSAQDRLLIVKSSNLKLEDERQFDFSGQFYGVGLPDVSFKGSVFAQDIPVEQVREHAAARAPSSPLTQISSSISGGRFQTVTAEFSGMLTGLQKDAQPVLNLSDIKMTGDFINLRLDYSYGQYQQLVGTLKGKLEVDVLTPGAIDRVLVSVAMTDGRLRVEDFPEIVRIPKADLAIRATPDRVSLSRLDIQTADKGSVSVQAERVAENNHFTTELSATSAFIDGAFVSAIWPHGIAPLSRKFVTGKFNAGRIENAEMKLAIKEAEKPIITEMLGHFDYRDAAFDWLSGLPAMAIGDSRVTFQNNSLTVTSKNSKAGSVDITAAEVQISPLIRPAGTEQKLDIVLRGKGSEHTILQLLGHPRVNQLSKLGLDKLNPKAELDFRFAADAALKPQTPLKLKNIVVGAELSDASFDNLPLNIDLKKGALELDVQGGKIQLSGNAELLEVPTQFSFFATANGDITLNAAMQPHINLQEFVSGFLPISLENQLGADISLSGNMRDKNFQADITSDISSVALYVEQLEWGKLSGEAGQFKGMITVEQNKLAKIDVERFKAAGLDTKGRVLFDRQGKLREVFVDGFVMPGTTLSSVIIERDSDAGYRLFAEGSKLDISHLTKFASGGTHPAFSFDVTAEEIKLGDGLKVSGNVVGSKKPQAQGEAVLQGTVTTDGITRLDQTSLTIGFGTGGFTAQGTSLIGGAEARLNYKTLEDGSKQLYILSENAGRVLDGLSITDAIKGGKLELKTIFSNQDRAISETTIIVDDFRLVKGAKAVRVYAVLFPTGLFSLFEGEGTFFNKGEAVIESNAGKHRITSLRAAGASVGLGLVGAYDTNSGQVDISGNLVPINAVSDVIGFVPLLGEILTGIDKSGLLVTQFSVKGPVDDLDVNVNPVSLLVPGLLRDLFSPNWLDSEAERIFNDNS